MANQIKYQVGFDVDNKSLKSLKDQLLQIQKMSARDFMKINPDSSLSEAKQQLSEIKNTAIQVDSALDKAFNKKLGTTNLQEFRNELKNLDLNSAYAQFSKLGATGQAAFRNMALQLTSVNTQIRESHSLLDRMATTLGNTIKWNVASSAINGVTRSVEQAWGYVKSLDTSLNNIRIVTGKSADEMANFAVQANNAAKELGKTTTDYTNAALIYAQQGLSDKEVEERAKITLKAANVTGQSTDAVSEQLTAVWNGYKVTAEEAELYVDRLAAVAATTASDLQELSTGMSKVASAAAAMGVGEDQLAAQLSTIISVTKQAPESVGTALRTVYARISDIKAGLDEDGVTLGNYSGRMAELGINVLDMNGNLRDMGEVMEEIGGKWGNLTREQQVYLAQTMAGQRQYNNLLALFDNFEQYNEALNTAQNAAGTLQKQQDIYMESTGAHLKELKASVEDIYDSFLNRESLDDVNKLIDALSDVSVVAAKFIDSLGGGTNILSSLGALGITVFSKQIAGSIQTTINNLKQGQQRAQSFQRAIEKAQELQNSGKGNDFTKTILSQQQNLLKIGNRISQQDFNIVQKSIADLSSTQGEIDRTQQTITALENTFKNLSPVFQDNIQKWTDLNEALESDDGIQIISEELKNFKEQFKSVFDKPLGDLQQNLKVLNSLPTTGDWWNNYQAQLSKTKESAQNLFETLLDQEKTFKGKTLLSYLPQEVQDSVTRLNDEFSKLNWQNLNAGQAKEAAKEISGVFQQLRAAITNQIKDTVEAINALKDKSPEELAKLKDKLKDLLDLRERQEKNVGDLTGGLASQIKIQDIVNLAGGIAQVGSAIKQVQSLGSIWKNQDLTTGEKLLQTISNLAISGPMLVNGITKVNAAFGLMKVITGEAAAVEYAKVMADEAHAVSLGKVRIAATKAGIAVGNVNKMMLLNPYVAVAAAVMVLVAAYNKFTMSAKQAEQALSNFNDKQAELTRNVSSNNKTIQDLKSLEDEYNNLSSIVGKYDQNINALSSEEKNRWNQIKQKIADINPDIVAAYDEQHNVILRNNDALDDTIAKLQKKNQLELHSFVNSDQFDKAVQATKVQSENARNNLATEQITNEDLGQKTFRSYRGQQIDAIIRSAKAWGDATSLEIEALRTITETKIEDLAEHPEYIKAFKGYLTNIKEAGNPRLQENEIEQLYKQLDSYVRQYEKSGGRLKAAQQAAQKTSEGNSSLLTYELMESDEYKQRYEELKKYAGQDAQNMLLAWAEGHKEGKAEHWDDWVRQGTDFEDDLISIYETSPDLVSKMKAANEEYKKQVFNSQQERVNYLVETFNNLIRNSGLENIDSNIFSELFNFVFGTNLSKQNFKNGQVESIGDNIIASVDDVRKYARNKLKISEESQDDNFLFSQLLKLQDKGINWDNILKGLQGKNFTTIEELKKILQEIIADQQIIQENQKNIVSLSSISTNGEKLQSGKNLSKTENQAYQENLTNVIDFAINNKDEDLLKSAQLLQQTWLAGSEEYQQALDKVLQKTIELRVEQAKKENRPFTQEQIADVEKYATTIERVNSLWASGAIEDEVHYHALLDKAIREELKTLKVSSSEYQNYIKQLEKLRKDYKSIVDGVDEYGESVDLSNEALKEMALNDLKLIDSLQKLKKAYKNTKDILNGDQESVEFRNAMSEMVNILNNIPGIHIDLTDENATTYLENIKEIAQGSQGAIQRLRQKLAEQAINEEIKIKASLDENSSIEILQELNNLIQQLSPQDIKTHAFLQQENFVKQLKQLVKNAGLTQEQCNKILGKIGVKAEIEYGTITEYADGKPITQQYIKKITYQPINSDNGGTTLSDDGGKGGSSGGSSSKPNTSQKEKKDPLKDQVDIYHDINIQIGNINRQLDNTKKKQDRLYGKDLIKNLRQQNKIIDQQINKLEEKYQLQEWDQRQKQAQLGELGVIFDSYGNIGNYMDILQDKQATLNKLIEEQYNPLITQYNQITDNERKQQLNQQISELDKTIQQEKKKLDDLKKGIQDYDKLMDDMQKNEDEREDYRQQQIENKIQDFRVEIEIRLDMGEAERDWNKFRRDVLEHTDIIKDTNFQGIFADATQNIRDITSYFNVRDSVGSLQKLTEQLNDTRAEIEAINDDGQSTIYGDNKKRAMEDLQNDLNELMGQIEDIQSLIDSVDEAYLSTIDDITEQFDKQIEDYEYVGDLIAHDIDLLSLLYGDRNYDAMNKYYETLERNNLKQLDSLKQQRDFWKEQWEAAVARGDTQAAKQFEENYKNTINNLNETIKEAAQNLQNKYINAIDKIFDELDRRISNGKGTDYLSTQWDLMNKNADEYLDTINSAFAIQETERKYQKALDETKSIKNQQALKNLMDEQLGILRNKEKITQYDIDRAEKLLQVEQARIALEDAQSAKTSMRLKRDSQGNYSYEYVADNGAVDEAQANLAQAQNDLYNFDKERYQSNLNDMLAAWKDFQSEYKDIIEDVSLTEQDRIEKLALLREEYGEYINDKTAENLVVRNNLMDSAFADLAALYQTDVENYNQMSLDEQNILMGDLVPAWKSGIQQMSDTVAGEGGFIPTCEEAFNNLTEATEDYKDELDDMAQTAEIDLEDVKNGVDDLSLSFEELIEDNTELTEKMYDEMTAISLLREQAHSLVEEYKSVYDAAKLAVSGIHSFIQAQRVQDADAAADYDDDEGSDSRTGLHAYNPSNNKPNVITLNSGSNNAISANDAATASEISSSSSFDDKVEGIAGNIWAYGTWGNGSTRKNNIISKFGQEQGEKIYSAVQSKFNNGYNAEHDWEYYKKFNLSKFDTGGYTGSWAGNGGKLAILHKREMVLNSEDTKNILDSVGIMRSIMSTLNGNMLAKLSGIRSGITNRITDADNGVEQNVHISASFPNVDSKREIEEAFDELVNLAAQRAMRR